MRTFEYVRASDIDDAIAAVTADPDSSFLAGGTTQLDLMKDGVLVPAKLVDITRLPVHGVAVNDGILHIGALTTMEELAAEPSVRVSLSFVREALLLGASVQLRNMATIGGNLLQRTRCRYFRDPAVAACNKREPGTGCAAMNGSNRMHAILGTSEHCIATHPSDLAVALVAADAEVQTRGAELGRSIPLTDFYYQPGDTPDKENVLEHGELITGVDVPLLPAKARSHYLKVRDRASYEFALTSSAVALVVEDGTISYARVALGGVGTLPWRAHAAEQILHGAPTTGETFRRAAEAAVEGARTRPGNAFKVELAKRTVVRALETVSGPTT
ncbi:xanthine dehydrogenase family protein subunit M [Rhodococcus sp. JVH1]|uniref:FAD binding domain-containing protein n=1 Tax=Rhodococcus sp. JVH1 TaxID=745408 RepID=UPI0005C1B768|nr:xanthine dehydrogenase family protein subunit M [Rhodococcus sp. JVH1]